MEDKKANAPSPSITTDVPRKLKRNKKTPRRDHPPSIMEEIVDDTMLQICPTASDEVPSISDYIPSIEAGRIESVPSFSDILNDKMEDTCMENVFGESHVPYMPDLPNELRHMDEANQGTAGPSVVRGKVEFQINNILFGDLPREFFASNFNIMMDGFINAVSQNPTEESRAQVQPGRAPSPMDMHELDDAATEILSLGHNAVANLQELEGEEIVTRADVVTDLPARVFNQHIFPHLPFNEIYKLREVNQKFKSRVQTYFNEHCDVRRSGYPLDVHWVYEEDLVQSKDDFDAAEAGVESIQYLLQMDIRLPKSNFNLMFLRTLELVKIFKDDPKRMIWDFVELYGSQIQTLTITRMGFPASQEEIKFYEDLPNLRELTVGEIDTTRLFPWGWEDLDIWKLPGNFNNLHSINLRRVEVAETTPTKISQKVSQIRQKIMALGVPNVTVMVKTPGFF